MNQQNINLDIIPVTAFQQNCSIIWDDNKNAAIIDPGGEGEKIIARVEQLGLNVQAILLTHGHLDHVGAAEQLKAHFNVPIYGANQLDDYWFASLPEQANQFGLAEIQPFTPDRWLNQEGEHLKIGDFDFEILHLPGHTPGHIGFIEHQKGIAFTGDVLFRGGIGRTDFPGGSFDQLIESIKSKLYPLPDEMIIIAGHGPYTTIGEEKRSNAFVRG